MRVAAYVYPGWHPLPERDAAVHPGFTEWELVAACRPRFPGHRQPKVPLLGPYDDRDPVAVGQRIRLAREHGVDAFVFDTFWCRGKRVFEEGLDQGFLGSPEGRTAPFAVLWANRLPRHVLPVRRSDLPVIAADRLVTTDAEDFVAFVAHLAARYFHRPNYLRVDGRVYLSIFDSTFFCRELGVEQAARAVRDARAWLAANGHPDLHLAAVDPSPEVIGQVRAIGFDSVTHYVLLPEWTGPPRQDYALAARRRAREWPSYAARSGLPYMPSVTTAWDASPRAADAGPERPGKYPWSPVVTGEHPRRFRRALARALDFARSTRPHDPLVFVASLNEWSEGHHLEPDTRFGRGWLEAVRDARRARVLRGPWTRAVLAWLLLIAVESVHGVLRQALLAPALGDLPARRWSLLTGAALILGVARLTTRFVGLTARRALLGVGALWVALTAAFEVALGRLALGYPWSRVLEDYDLSRGGLMGLGLLWLLLAPTLAARLAGRGA